MENENEIGDMSRTHQEFNLDDEKIACDKCYAEMNKTGYRRKDDGI